LGEVSLKDEKCSKKQDAMSITPEKVKTFILDNIILTKDRNIQVQLEYMRSLGILNLFIGIFFFFLVHVRGLSEGIGTIFFAIYFYTTIILSIFIGFLAIKIKKKAISNINKIFDGKKVPNRKEIVWWVGLSGPLGLIIGSRINLSGNAPAFVGIALGSLFMLMSAFLTPSAQYELYLLKKYCPEIAYLEAGDLIPKKTTISKNKKKK